MTRAATVRTIVAILAALGWFALVLQFALLLQAAGGMGIGSGEAAIRFFSYFTIQVNIFAAMALTAFAIRSRAAEWLIHPFVRSAIAVYIAVVGLTYFALLRQLWAPQGTQWLVDVVLHYVMPVAYVAFWFTCVRKSGLKWYDPLLWLIYPLLYLGLVLIRGGVSGFYPYPFIDAGSLGYRAVAANTAGLAVACVVLGGLFVVVGRLSAKA